MFISKKRYAEMETICRRVENAEMQSRLACKVSNQIGAERDKLKAERSDWCDYIQRIENMYTKSEETRQKVVAERDAAVECLKKIGAALDDSEGIETVFGILAEWGETVGHNKRF